MDSGSEEIQLRQTDAPGPFTLPYNTSATQTRQDEYPTEQRASSSVKTFITSNNMSQSPLADHSSIAQAQFMKTWLSHRSHISSLRSTILVMRTNLRKERLQCWHKEDVEQKLQAQCLNCLSEDAIYKNSTESWNRWIKTFAELKRCRADLISSREQTAALEDALSSQEYQLDRLEETIYSDVAQPTDQDGPYQPVQTPSSFLHTALPIDNDHDHDMGLLEKLYMRMGDIRIYHERLSNFEFDLRERAEERELIRAAGTNQLSTDAVFFDRARVQRSRIQEEHTRAHEDVHLLKQQCTEQGIEFQEPEFAKSMYCTLLESTTPSSSSIQAPPNMVGDYFASQERVETWLGKPTEPELHVSDDDEETDHQESSRHPASPDMVWISSSRPEKQPLSDKGLRRRYSAPYDMSQWRMTPSIGSHSPEVIPRAPAAPGLGTILPHLETRNLPRARHSLAIYE